MNIIIIGLSITSSWGNGHATTYRSLVKGLHKRGHNVLFLERDLPWYSSNRDMPDPEFCKVRLYNSLQSLNNFVEEVTYADLVITGSFVPDGIAVGEWVMRTASGITAFYDIDTPVTLGKLRKASCEYLSVEQISNYDIYLSFSAGPCLEIIESEFGSPSALPLYCSVDPDLYYPMKSESKWDLGYLGTYSSDRQDTLNENLLNAARKWKEGRFVVAGPQYPDSINWPENVQRIPHLPPSLHNNFYNSQRYTLNITRQDMIKVGYSPSVRLFEAAACGIPVISDYWDGIETIFNPGEEILISSSSQETIRFLSSIHEASRRDMGEKARQIVLKHHTGEHRAAELEKYITQIRIKEKKKKVKVT